jgi:hypothetical protein
MAEVKNVVPSFEEFSKDPQKFMAQTAAQPGAAQEAPPAAEPGETDSILGAQAGTETPGAATAQGTPPAEGEQAGAEQAGAEQAGAEGPEPAEGEEPAPGGLV